MSGHDLYSDEFPSHGTTAGYKAGCHSSGACPGKLERGQSCVQANMRFAAEWGYRKAVLAGQELAFLDGETIAVEPPKPTPRPKPSPPTPVAADLQQWPEESAPQPAGSLAKSEAAFALHPKQRDHALATASEEHPMGLTLGGEPRRRCAPGTVLVDGVLHLAGEEPVVAAEPVVVVEKAPAPSVEQIEDEQERPRGKRMLDDALRTLAEAAEMQRAIAEISERALHSVRIEINHLRREIAADKEGQAS